MSSVEFKPKLGNWVAVVLFSSATTVAAHAAIAPSFLISNFSHNTIPIAEVTVNYERTTQLSFLSESHGRCNLQAVHDMKLFRQQICDGYRYNKLMASSEVPAQFCQVLYSKLCSWHLAY